MDDLLIILFLTSLLCLIIAFIKPSLFSRFLKEKATRKNSIIIFGLSTIILFILIGVTTEPLTTNSTDKVENKTKEKEQKNLKETENKNISAVEYEILEIKDQSYKALGNKSLSDYTTQEIRALPLDKKMAYRIVVISDILEDQVTPTIQKIINDITTKDIDIDEITIWIFSDRNLINGAYDVATATWAPEGKLGNVTPKIAKSNDRTNYKTTIKIRENLEEYLSQRVKSEDKFGFTEEERREYFKEIVAAEDKARIEADKIYPIDIFDPNYKQENIIKNIDKNRELTDKYKKDVRNAYGITKDVEVKIVNEAFKESWSME